ncbi:hypothetical protein RHSIM_Rhsim02G0216300 [Rhododendron simsii]|uniref:Folate-biopterin transporter 2 n=1 Tax=Rhododendron simsii TaxID=118357 RepID=A0A834HLE5_RHOSS|nr:hypothetical protein RHSIM_Rhsim02G0216300 [Rhododendron simsii]
MVEEEELPICGEIVPENEAKKEICGCVYVPIRWFRMLAREMHWSFVFGVVVTYGISQGLGGALNKVGTQYYMKDVQKVQPSEAQVYSGITTIPWIVKPIWGILTDVVPILGYHRRPYFILAGAIGVISMLFLSLDEDLHIFFALLALTAGSASVAIADVTIDACVAQKSGTHPSIASDMQSLCALSSSIGALVGYSFSGILVHLIGPVGVLGLLAIPSGLVLIVGVVLNESHVPDFSYRQVTEKFISAWMFYWLTDATDGPSFSKATIGYIYSIGAVGALLGAILYQYGLKDYPFRKLCFWTQLLFGVSGMLDLFLVLRLNLKFGIPDYLFVVIDACVSDMIARLKWMPILVLSSKLCPPGIEGTLFALLMSIDNAGVLSGSWGGGLLLHVLNVTRTKFDKLWLVILIRNLLRISPLCLLFLIPGGDPNAALLPTDILDTEEGESPETESIELAFLADNGDGKSATLHG